jgi:hypothetical protein
LPLVNQDKSLGSSYTLDVNSLGLHRLANVVGTVTIGDVKTFFTSLEASLNEGYRDIELLPKAIVDRTEMVVRATVFQCLNERRSFRTQTHGTP